MSLENLLRTEEFSSNKSWSKRSDYKLLLLLSVVVVVVVVVVIIMGPQIFQRSRSRLRTLKQQKYDVKELLS